MRPARCATKGVGCLVVTESGRPLGIVTDRDLVVRFLAEGLDASAPVGEFTTYGPRIANIHDSIETVSAWMPTTLLLRLGRALTDGRESIENRSDATDSR